MFLYNQLGGTPTIPIGELTGDATTVQTITGNDGGTEAATGANYAIGGLNTSTNFPGNFVFNVGIIKVGTGRLSLDGVTMSYTGITTVSNGNWPSPPRLLPAARPTIWLRPASLTCPPSPP